MRPWDAHALTRPVFTEDQFTPTKFDGAADKARFANALTRFIAADFPDAQWTDRLYRRLSNCFGHIAWYDKHGFKAQFFTGTARKVAFLEETMQHRCIGQPEYTYSDVEQTVIRRLHACGVLPYYRALRFAEVEGAERELLARLQAKYEGTRPAATPVPQSMHVATPAPTSRKPSADGRQASLI